MPIIPARSHEQAVNDCLMSVALAEVAVAHFISAEAENLEAAVRSGRLTTGELTELQREILKAVKTALKLQMLLQMKMEDLRDLKEQEPAAVTPVR